MNRSLIATLAAIAGGGVIGWLAVPGPALAPRRPAPKTNHVANAEPQSIEQILAAENSPAARIAKFAALVESSTSAKELASIYRKLASLGILLPPGTVEEFLLPKLALLDGKLAFRSASEEHKSIVLMALAEADPAALIESIRSMSAGDRHKHAPDALKTIADSDPLTILELLRDKKLDGFDPENVEQHALRSLALGDPGAAVAWLDEIPLTARERLATSVVEGWSETDPENAYRWAIAMRAKDSKSWGRPGATAMRKWGEKDPYAALDALFELNDPKMIGQVATDLFSSAAASDPQRAIDLLNENPEIRDDVHQSAIAGISRALIHTDLDLAIKLASEIPSSKRYLLDYAIVRAQVEADPDAAYESILSNGENREQLLEMVVDQAGNRGGIPEIRKFLERSIPDGAWKDARRVPNFSDIVRDIAYSDEAAAIDWIKMAAEALPAEVLESSFRLGDDAAPSFVTKLIGEFPLLDLADAALATAASLARQDPAAAAAWIETLPEAMRADARANVAIGVAQADLKMGIDWASNLPEKRDRDRAINNVAQIHADLGELPPLEFIMQASEEVRAGLLEQHFRLRARRNPGEARVALATMEPEVQEKLEAVIANPSSENPARLQFR